MVDEDIQEIPISYYHLFIRANLAFLPTDEDVDVRRMSTKVSMRDIRKAASQKETLDKLLSESWNIASEAKNVFATEVLQRPVIRHWYLPKGRWQRESATDKMAEQRQKRRQDLKKLEDLYYKGKSKEFFELVKSMTRIREAQPLVRGIVDGDGQAHFDQAIKHQAIANYLNGGPGKGRKVNPGPIQAIDNRIEGSFTHADIEAAIKDCNFNKALGPDLFDGTLLSKISALTAKVVTQLAQALNSGTVPEYLTEGRLIPFSKQKGQDCVPLEHIHPIVVRSNISKIMERAILNRVMQPHMHLLKTGIYQAGFKDGQITAIHLTSLLQDLALDRRAPTKLKHILLVDLTQAYNNFEQRQTEGIPPQQSPH